MRFREQAVVEHFSLVADESPVPIVIYNIPYRTGRGLGAGAVVEAAAHPNIVGLKQSVAALDTDTLEIMAQTADRFFVLAGLCTPLFIGMTRAALNGDVQTARTLAAALLPVVSAGFAEPNPAVWKGALHRSGEIESPELRRPMTAASANAVDQLVAAAAKVGCA